MLDHDYRDAPDDLRTPIHQRWRLNGPAEIRPFLFEYARENELAVITILHEPRWRAAITGDAAAAIGLALSYDRPETPPPLFDAIMTLVSIAALRGDGAAILVLRQKLARFARTNPPSRRAYERWCRAENAGFARAASDGVRLFDRVSADT